MKVTRYPQSCLVLEDSGHKLVIDPGDDFTANHDVSELDGVEAALGNPEIYKMFAEGTSMPFEVRVLVSGGSTEI